MGDSKREDFSQSDIRTLWQRVGGKCSNPNCRKETCGPNVDAKKGVLIGQAAHIIGAIKDSGPRHDSSLPDGERGNINNAIWLCDNCARLIDVDEKKYSVELLRKWKADAEYEQSCILEGKKPYDDNKVVRKQTTLQSLMSILMDLHNVFGYAVSYYEGNFSHLSKNDIDDAIGRHKYLYENSLKSISEFHLKLNELFILLKNNSLDISSEIESLVEQYRDCFYFKYYDDGGIGLDCDYWSSLFVSFSSKKDIEKKLYSEIKQMIRNEY